MPNAWIQHVKNFQSQNPSMSWRECLINAKSSYTKSQSLSRRRAFWKKGGMYNPYDPCNTKDPSQPYAKPVSHMDGHDDTEYITQQYMQQPYNPYPKYTRHDYEPVFKKDDFGSLNYEIPLPKEEPSNLDRIKSGINKSTKQIGKSVNKLVKQVNQSKNKPNITMIPKPSFGAFTSKIVSSSKNAHMCPNEVFSVNFFVILIYNLKRFSCQFL